MKTQSGKHKQNILSSCVTLMTNTGIRFQALYDGDDGIWKQTVATTKLVKI